MKRAFRVMSVILALAWCGGSVADGQHAGSRATQASTENDLPALDPATVNSHIVISGSSQQRVVPTQIRMVWAVTGEATDPGPCQRLVQSRIEAAQAAWEPIGIAADGVVEDFISAIPQFQWRIETQEGEQILVERQVGYRIQVNLHVAVASDSQARQVIAAALAAGLTDLIAVDYTANLAEAQAAARREALAQARLKAGDLLSAIFDAAPAPINVHEQTRVFAPEQMYDSFENVADQNVYARYDDTMRRVGAYRPRNTYYQGLTRAADSKSYDLPMHPEIVVESKVALYFESPAAEKDRARPEDSHDRP